MEAFYYAGGLPALLKELLPMLHGDALTVAGMTLAEAVKSAEVFDAEVIRPLRKPLAPEGGTIILTGNLCPNGAVLKRAAASPELLKHGGAVVVFESAAEILAAALERPFAFQASTDALRPSQH